MKTDLMNGWEVPASESRTTETQPLRRTGRAALDISEVKRSEQACHFMG
jgi:hypothetical protein